MRAETLLRAFVALFLERFALDLELHDAARRFVQFGRHRVDFGAQLRRGFVDQIDGLIGQEAVRDVAVRERRGGDEGRSLMRTP